MMVVGAADNIADASLRYTQGLGKNTKSATKLTFVTFAGFA